MADEELRGRESRQRPPREITVSEAAAALRVSERTVLNFIKEKRIKAVKVGKKWFVDAQSVRDLASGGGRSGVMPPFGGEFSANAANSEFSAFAEKSEIAETKMRKNFSENSANSENTENTEIAEKGTSGSTLPRARGLEESALELVFGVRQAGVVGVPAAKKNACLQASNALDRLRVYAQICSDLGFFSETAYFEISEKSGAIGRQLGGWMKSLGQPPVPPSPAPVPAPASKPRR